MGITGLLPFLKNSCRPVNIRDFKGVTVAIDAYSWLHKGAFSCAEKLVKGEKTDGYVHYCMKQLNMLLDAGVKPIMVFDGCNLDSKAVTEKKRRENRERTRQKGKEFLCQGKLKEARECFQRCVDVTPEMAFEVIQACRSKNIDYIVAPYEADAQLAYLNITNMCQIVITEDSDLVLFGCEKILFKMDVCGGGNLYEKENLPKSFGAQAEKMSFEKFRLMCILSGCDYLPSLPGIGLAKACKFFSLTNNPDIRNALSKLPSYLKMPKLVVTPEYIEDFLKANNTFLYQLVYCPKKKALVPLHPYPEGIDYSDMEYAGRYFPDDLAVQIASGDVNVKTLEKFEKFSPKKKSVSSTTSSRGGSSLLSREQSKNPTQEKKSFFKFKNRSSDSCSSVKKRSFHETEKETEVLLQDDSLFSVYSAENSKKQKKEEKKDVFDADDEDFITSRTPNKESEVKNDGKRDDSSNEISPFRKSLEKKLSATPTANVSMPLKKVVRSRFFVSSEKKDSIQVPNPSAKLEEGGAKTKLQKSIVSDCMDSIDEEYGSMSTQDSLQMDSSYTNNSPADSSCPSEVSSNCSMIDSGIDCSPNVADDKENYSRPSISSFRHSSKPKSGYNLSSGSTDNSLNGSYESHGASETEESRTPRGGVDIPFRAVRRNSPTSPREPLESLECTDDVIVFDLEDSPIKVIGEVAHLKSAVDEKTVPQHQEKNVSKSLFSSGKKASGKPSGCRSVGLSKNRPKSAKQLAMQDTLFNFRFTRLPKNEANAS